MRNYLTRDPIIVACLVFLMGICGYAQKTPSQPQKTEKDSCAADNKLQNIKAVSEEEAANSKSVIIIKPLLITGVKNNVSWMDYDLGGINISNIGLSKNDPYRLPYSMQLHAEALRKLLSKNPEWFNADAGHLERMDFFVCQAVHSIQTTSDQKKLDAELTVIGKQFFNELQLFDSDLQNFTKAKNLQLGEPGVGRIKSFSEADAYSVKVTTAPEGGKVRVVSAYVWKICVRNGCDREKMTWRTLNVGGTEGLIGGYHYLAEWGDGSHDEGDITIDRDQNREFKPFRR